MLYIHNKIQQWKQQKDYEYASSIYKLLTKFWSSNRRKDFVIEMLLTMDLTNEDLTSLGDLLGYTAHMRERKNNSER